MAYHPMMVRAGRFCFTSPLAGHAAQDRSSSETRRGAAHTFPTFTTPLKPTATPNHPAQGGHGHQPGQGPGEGGVERGAVVVGDMRKQRRGPGISFFSRSARLQSGRRLSPPRPAARARPPAPYTHDGGRAHLSRTHQTNKNKTQLVSNINACCALADTVRSTLGPRGMDKLIHDDRVSLFCFLFYACVRAGLVCDHGHT
jgi:hypothetical protein